ncbi:MAG TPA: hypothetical protein VFH95_11535 [Candidatus Kapabacteria bacterium]|nr:hypothetical protein [Candidatus Kapabacteria bacterium]
MHSIKFWAFVSLLTLGVIFAFGWGGPATRFPLALGLLRVAFLVIEQVWPRARV